MSPIRLLLPLVLGPLAAPLAQTTITDSWSPTSFWRTPDGRYGVAAHASLLPDGRVHLIGWYRDTEVYTSTDPQSVTAAAFTLVPTPLGTVTPADTLVTDVPFPTDVPPQVNGNLYTEQNLFCAGHALLEDGSIFTAGGAEYFANVLTGTTAIVGLSYATLYDGTTWERIPEDMTVISPSVGHAARWYPAVTRLPDNRLLITGGSDFGGTMAANLSAEIYDRTTGAWEIVADYGQAPPQIFNHDYTHPIVLPREIEGNDLLMFGQDGLPVLLDLDDPVTPWHVSTAGRPEATFLEIPNSGSASVPLPLRLKGREWGYSPGSMLIAGGEEGSAHQDAFDVYDPVLDAWHPKRELHALRKHPSMILLPDGQLCILGGHDFGADPRALHASYVDPAAGFSLSVGSDALGEVRGYHTLALLLPDGRVLVGGGSGSFPQDLTEKATLRYLSPPYMSRPRPVIEDAPEVIAYGESFQVTSSNRRVREAVLVGLGSMTHSYDASQRYIQLRLRKERRRSPAAETETLTLVAPPDRLVAQEGYFMLFLLDADRTPSVAEIVRLQ